MLIFGQTVQVNYLPPKSCLLFWSDIVMNEAGSCHCCSFQTIRFLCCQALKALVNYNDYNSLHLWYSTSLLLQITVCLCQLKLNGDTVWNEVLTIRSKYQGHWNASSLYYVELTCRIGKLNINNFSEPPCETTCRKYLKYCKSEFNCVCMSVLIVIGVTIGNRCYVGLGEV